MRQFPFSNYQVWIFWTLFAPNLLCTPKLTQIDVSRILYSYHFLFHPHTCQFAHWNTHLTKSSKTSQTPRLSLTWSPQDHTQLVQGSETSSFIYRRKWTFHSAQKMRYRVCVHQNLLWWPQAIFHQREYCLQYIPIWFWFQTLFLAPQRWSLPSTTYKLSFADDCLSSRFLWIIWLALFCLFFQLRKRWHLQKIPWVQSHLVHMASPLSSICSNLSSRIVDSIPGILLLASCFGIWPPLPWYLLFLCNLWAPWSSRRFPAPNLSYGLGKSLRCEFRLAIQFFRELRYFFDNHCQTFYFVDLYNNLFVNKNNVFW